MTGLVSPTPAHYAQMLANLAPSGDAWPTDPASVHQQVYQALALTLWRLNNRANYLVTDAFPATTEQLLTDWETALGLPDPCAGPDQSIEQAQAHVVARLTQTTGPSVASLIAFAATIGYPVTIQQFVPARFGMAFGGAFCGDAWAFAWQITAPTFTVDYRKFGDVFGEPYATWGSTVLQCEMHRLSPAHTTLLFSH